MRKSLMVLALAAGSSLAMAQDSGFYARGLLGQADVDIPLVDNDTAFSIGGGWRFLPYFSAEAGYSDFGSFDSRGLPGGNFGVSVDSLEIGLASKIPFGESGFFGQARLGIHQWDAEVDGPGTEDDLDTDGSDPYYGVALGYDFNERFGVSLNFDRYDFDDGEVDRIGVGGELRF